MARSPPWRKGSRLSRRRYSCAGKASAGAGVHLASGQAICFPEEGRLASSNSSTDAIDRRRGFQTYPMEKVHFSSTIEAGSKADSSPRDLDFFEPLEFHFLRFFLIPPD
jgi:hypothetical protein